MPRVKNQWFSDRKQQFPFFADSLGLGERDSAEMTTAGHQEPTVDDILRGFVAIPYGDEETDFGDALYASLS